VSHVRSGATNEIARRCSASAGSANRPHDVEDLWSAAAGRPVVLSVVIVGRVDGHCCIVFKRSKFTPKSIITLRSR